MGSSVTAELQLFLLLASLAGALFVYPARYTVPVHYNLWAEPDLHVEQGQFIYPALFLFFWLGSRRGHDGSERQQAVSRFRSSVLLTVSVLVAALQIQASLVGLHGPSAPALPTWLLPLFLAVLALVMLVGTVGIVRAKSGERRSERRPRSPRSPRSLIRALSSPEVDEEPEQDDGDEEYVAPTPTQRRKSPGRRSPRRKSQK
jgi:hypothetical protein